MIKVSDSFKLQTKKIKQQHIKLGVLGGELTVKEVNFMTVKQFNALPVWLLRKRKKVIAKELRYSFEGSLFKTIMKQIEITVKNAGGLKEKNVNFQYGLYINNDYEYINLGDYYIKDIEDNKGKKELVVTGYDKMINFMKPFKQSDLQLTYPCTMLSLIQKMCEICGVELYSTDFFNADLQVDEDYFTAQELTYRDVLDKVAQSTLTTIFIKDNKLYLHKLANTSVEKLDTSYLTGLTVKEKFGPVNALVLGRGDVKDNVEAKDDTSIVQNGRCEIRFDENEFVEYKRKQVIDKMFEQIKGLEYYAFESSDLGVMWLEPCDLIELEDSENNTYKTIYLSANITINTGISSDIEADIPKTTNTEYKVTTKEQKKTLKVERLAKKNEGLIQDLIEETSENSQKLSQHEQTIKGMKDTISSTNKVVDELSKDIQVYSADLDIYNITIPVDENKNPLEDKDYEVNFYTYFKGTQVTSNAATTSTNKGITCTIDKTIKFSVKANTKITNLSNEFVISFIYQDGKEVYTVSKKIVLTLSLKGEKGETGEKGDTGAQGIPGANGTDGTSYYFYVRYSANSTGNPMTTTPTSTTEYMGVASTTAKTAPTSYSAYTWSKIKGEDGENGSPGQNGTNGETSYLHIKYSDDGKTFTPADDVFAEGERPGAYLGQYTDFVKEDSTEFSDYTWYKFTQDIDPVLNDLQSQTQQNATDIANNYQDLINKVGDLATQESVVSLEKRLEVVKTDTDMTISAINDIQVNGVSKVTTETGFTFNDKGLTIDKTGAKTKANLNEAGLNIQDATGSTDESLLFAGYDEDAGETIVKSKNMTVEKYLVVGAFSRFEDYIDVDGNKGTGCFWIAE